MISFKTILAGTIATSLIFLFNQFVFILIAGYSGVWLADSAFWQQNRELIWQAMGLLTLIISMSLGGVVVSMLSNDRRATHGLIVGLLTSSIFLLFARDLSKLNMMSTSIFFLGTLCTALSAHLMPAANASDEKTSEEL